MTKFKTTELDKINGVGNNSESKKVFLHDILSLTSCEISINAMPAGVKLPFSHKNKQNEEVYIFLKGEAIMTLDDKVIEVHQHSCVKVTPNVIRTIEAKTNLEYICVQAKADSLEQFGLGDAELC